MMPTILIIEDTSEIRDILRRVLERAGYTVLEAPDGEVGTRMYREHRADLIITDIIMPEKEGLETIMELRKDFPDIKIIAISGGGSAMSGTACLNLARKLGAAVTLNKPLEFKQLLDSVRSLLAGPDPVQ
jgi:two-component system, chemotaxis family, chemotaxis protein CheY